MIINYACKHCGHEHDVIVHSVYNVEMPENCEGCGQVIPERATEEVLERHYEKCQPQPEDDQ